LDDIYFISERKYIFSGESHIHKIIVVHNFNVLCKVLNTMVDGFDRRPVVMGHVHISDRARLEMVDFVRHLRRGQVIFLVVTGVVPVSRALPIGKWLEKHGISPNHFVSSEECFDRQWVRNVH